MTLTTHAPAARPARPGFTLIEMLVVVAIIGVLVSILGVAYQKTVERQRISTTKTELYKLQQSLDSEYDRVVKKCALDTASAGTIPPQIMLYAEGDENRGRAIWTALNLRRQIPETFAEALAPVSVVSNVTAGTLSLVAGTPPAGTIYTLQPLEIFRIELQGITVPAGTPANEESGALAYIILAKKSVSGGGAMASAADDLSATTQTKVTIGGKEFPVFADKWGNAVGLYREYRLTAGDPKLNLENVQSAPYVDAQIDIKVKPTANRDPIDPRNLVAGWTTAAGAANTVKRKEMVAFGFSDGVSQNSNRLATVFSVGKTKVDSSGNPTPEDDIYGYPGKKLGK